MEDITGNATENGESSKETPPQEKSIPFSRFQEVVNARKAAEQALESLVTELASDIPEEFRDLIPTSLPPTERAAWIRSAKAKGLFTASVPASSPDAKRPGGKPTQDLSGLNPSQMMRAGYGQ